MHFIYLKLFEAIKTFKTKYILIRCVIEWKTLIIYKPIHIQSSTFIFGFTSKSSNLIAREVLLFILNYIFLLECKRNTDVNKMLWCNTAKLFGCDTNWFTLSMNGNFLYLCLFSYLYHKCCDDRDLWFFFLQIMKSIFLFTIFRNPSTQYDSSYINTNLF